MKRDYTFKGIDTKSESYKYYSSPIFDDDPDEYADTGVDPYVDPDELANLERAEREDREWREANGVEVCDDSYYDDLADEYFAEMCEASC